MENSELHPGILKAVEEWRAQGYPEQAIQEVLEQTKKYFDDTLGRALGYLVYERVGHGITQWAKMEERLIEIVAKLLDTTREKAGLIMYSITNFHAWINIIDELFVFDAGYPNSIKMWRGLVENLRSENDIRVRLAHHSASNITGDELFKKGLSLPQLTPSQLDRRSKTQKMKPLELSEIEDFPRRIAELNGKLTSLLQTMEQPESSR